MVDRLDVVVQVVVEFGLVGVGTAQGAVIPLSDLGLFLPQPGDLSLHLPLAAQPGGQQGEEQHHRQQHPGPHLVFVQRQDGLFREGDGAEQPQDRQGRGRPLQPGAPRPRKAPPGFFGQALAICTATGYNKKDNSRREAGRPGNMPAAS